MLGWIKKATVSLLGVSALGAGWVSSVSVAKADVYTEPGTYLVNGRQWKTRCSNYTESGSVVRCTTDIWATQIKYSKGKFTQVNGWVFNNLTYKPSARSMWKNNPLAIPGNHTINGRKWYVECDTAWTGGNACRSMIEASVIVKSGSGYAWEKKMVFNNIVMFSTPPRDVYAGHRYEVVKQALSSWYASAAYCERKGGYLATIGSKAENEWLYSFVRSAGVESAYFGLYKAGNSWKWRNKEVVKYLNWADGEPNDERGQESYGMFYWKFSDGKWNDGDYGDGTVGDDKAFICEWNRA